MSKIVRQDTNGVKPLLAVGELGYDNYPTGGDAGRVYVGTGSANIPQATKAEVVAVDGKVDTHVARADNPHTVTKAQVGLGAVDNTSDANKPISTATQTALNTKQGVLVSGTNIKTVEGQSLVGSGNIDLTKSDVGLNNVDNTADSTKNVLSAGKWTTSRNITIGNSTKSVDGAGNVAWTLAEIGAIGPASPALTGVPTAPTAAVNTSTTQLATTAFVNAEIANDAVPRVASTDNAIVRFNGVTGAVQNSGVTIDDNNNIYTAGYGVVTSPNIDSTGAIGLVDAIGNPDAVYIQALNNERNAQYGSLKFNKNGTITPSGNIVGNISGNSATATKLATARTINGMSFDGSENISVGLDSQSSLITTSFTLNSTHKNKLLVCAGPFTITLPNTAIKSGDLFIISNAGTGTILLDINGNYWDLSRASILPGETLIIQNDGSGASSFYRFVSRSKDFASNINATAGYTYLPNGVIMQWGRVSTSIAPGGILNITFPVTFPNDIFYSNVAIVDASTNNQLTIPFVGANALSNLAVTNHDGDSTITQIRWFSIGC